VNNLLRPISVDDSSKKVKTDTVLTHKESRKHMVGLLDSSWKRLQREKKPSYDTEADPSEGLMNVLKKIYEDGDDDMKWTINKV
jgi:calcyclin binding protein